MSNIQFHRMLRYLSITLQSGTLVHEWETMRRMGKDEKLEKKVYVLQKNFSLLAVDESGSHSQLG